MIASTGAQSQVVGRVPPGSDPTKVAAALQTRPPIEEGKVCHIDVLMPQKVSRTNRLGRLLKKVF